MPVVTIISDWEARDYFLGAVKGALMAAVDNIRIIDIAHGIPKHDIVTGLFVLKSCFRFYPEGTVHLFCIRSESLKDSKVIIVNILLVMSIACRDLDLKRSPQKL